MAEILSLRPTPLPQRQHQPQAIRTSRSGFSDRATPSAKWHESLLRRSGNHRDHCHDAEKSASLLSEVKALGVRLDIDDFGTGYSSLSRLLGFRVDTLKIDRVFVSRMDRDAETHEIVRVIIMLAHHLGLKVVAEGVETQAQLDLLRHLGCKRAQGDLFSKPVDHDAILKLLAINKAKAFSGFRSKAAGATARITMTPV